MKSEIDPVDAYGDLIRNLKELSCSHCIAGCCGSCIMSCNFREDVEEVLNNAHRVFTQLKQQKFESQSVYENDSKCISANNSFEAAKEYLEHWASFGKLYKECRVVVLGDGGEYGAIEIFDIDWNPSILKRCWEDSEGNRIG